MDKLLTKFTFNLTMDIIDNQLEIIKNNKPF